MVARFSRLFLEKLDEFGFGVRVVKPDCAAVGRVGGVVCEFGCVERVPATTTTKKG